MGKMKNIKELSLNECKIQVYDRMVLIRSLQQEIQILEDRIIKLKEQKVEPKSTGDKK